MRRLLILVTALLLCIAGAGLASAAAAPSAHRSIALPAISSPPVAASRPEPPAVDPTIAAARVEQATQEVLPAAQVSFEVFDRATNSVLTSQNADRQVASMSVVKLLIALDVLAGDNWATPEPGTQQQLHQMLANSDDQISDDLWTAGGGPAIVTRMVNLLGLTGTRAPDDPGQWGDTLITPQDMVTVYRYITDKLPKSDQELILGALSDSPKIAADDFNQYFGIPDGLPNSSWAIKQGWGTSGSEAVMNSTGLVGPDWRYVVIVLAAAPANSYATLPAVVTAAAGALAGSVQATVS
ncbi:MAG TPA: hypothetical protein VF003_15160 [Pseudonocardiaceae bacterium]